MEQFFIMEGEEQKGPFTPANLQILRKSGRISGDTMVWREGMDDWKPLDEVQPVPEPQPRDSAATNAAPPPYSPQPTSSSKTPTTKGVELYQKHVLSRFPWLRPKWLLASLGIIAALASGALFYNSTPSEAELRNAVEESIPELRLGFPVTMEGYTVSNKYPTSIQGESRLVYDMEVRIRPTVNLIGSEKPALHYRAVVQYAKRGRLWYHWTAIADRDVLAKQISATLAKGVAEVESKNAEDLKLQQKKQELLIAAGKVELLRKDAEDRKRENEAQAARRAQDELDNQKREFERAKEARAEKARMEAEQIKLEEEQRITMQKNAELAKKADLAKKQEQEQRAAFAAKLFSRLDTLVVLSATLKKQNVTIEYRGSGVEGFESFFKNRDHLKFINFLTGKSYVEYPPEKEIEAAIKGGGSRDFKILLKTKLRTDAEGNDLWLLSFPGSNRDPFWKNGSIMQEKRDGELHPDGIGYLFNWSPSVEPNIFVVGDSRSVSSPIDEATRYERKEVEFLEKKKSLGEIDEATYVTRVTELRKKNRDTMRKWALSR